MQAEDWGRTLGAGGLVPLYASTQELARVGLDSGGFRRLIGAVLREYGNSITDPLPADLCARHRLLPLATALHAAHFPKSSAEITEALRRLKYDELFEFQIKLALQRSLARKESGGIAFNVQSARARTFVDALPFRLTAAQVKVVKEILDDMKAPRAMHRLLQGDVGSGKTVVALIAMLVAVDNGYQAVFVAPDGDPGGPAFPHHARAPRRASGELPAAHRCTALDAAPRCARGYPARGARISSSRRTRCSRTR